MGRLSRIKRELKSFSGNDRGKTLAAISSGWFLLIGSQMIYPVLLPYFRSEYGLSLTMAGALLTMIWLTNAISTFPGGILTDQIDGMIILIMSLLISLLAFGLIILSNSLTMLFGATALFGVGLGLYGIARFTVIYEMFPERIGASSGVIMAAADAGQTILPPVASVIAVTVAWRFGLAFTIPLIALVTLWLWLVNPQKKVVSDPNERLRISKQMQRVLVELQSTTIIYGTLVLILYAIVWAAFTGFYPLYLVDIKGISSTNAAFLFAVFFGFGIVIKPASGAVYDRVGVKRSLLFVVTVPSFALAILPYVYEFWLLFFVTGGVSLILGSGAILQPYLIETFSDDVKGTGLATVRTIFLAISSISPIIFGNIADRGWFDELYFILSLLAGICIIFILLLPGR